jgi:hypothetical protein
MGLKWGGSRARALEDQVHRIAGTVFTARVWSAPKRRHERLTYTVWHVHTSEERQHRDTPSDDGVVRLVLSPFLVEQLRAGQFARVDWGRLYALRSDLAQRLYVFLHGQRGWLEAGGLLTYNITIDAELAVSLGHDDARLRQLRRKLAQAGAAICAADPSYLAVEVRPGRGGAFILATRRRAPQSRPTHAEDT